MNNLFADIGYKSINHFGEQLCGDHIEVSRTDQGDIIIVLADGLGSGVKASILSTLTSKIISTMLAEGLSLEECVQTITTTLPVCSERNVAYSTFTILRIHQDSTQAEIIQFENPLLILLRNGHNYNYPKREAEIAGKTILLTNLRLHPGDVFILMSDGCPYAGSTPELNYNWQRGDIITFMETLVPVGYTAKTMATQLVDACENLYGGKPGDDTTACVIRMLNHSPLNLLFGPPKDPKQDEAVMSAFFSSPGKHIVCGGATAAVAARYLNKPVIPKNNTGTDEVPPISSIEGVDLVTEGIITLRKALTYIHDYLGDNELYSEWAYNRDGASLIARALLEGATDIHIFAGDAENPAHQIAGVQIGLDIKKQIVKDMEASLSEIGKNVTVERF